MDRVKQVTNLTVALILQKKVTYLYLIVSKAVLYPLRFQQFPI